MKTQRYTDITQQGWGQIWELYTNSFPPCEQRLERDQILAMRDPDFFAMGIWDQETFVGLFFYWNNSSFCYVEHFAIHPSLRGQGYGTRCLGELCRPFDRVILEIELPIDDATRRRQHFYERFGFQSSGYQHSHPPYRLQDAPHELLALSYPSALTPQLQQEFLHYRASHVMQYAEPARASAR